jgi:HAD superfamily hydrolase (TIGR01509 family)
MGARVRVRVAAVLFDLDDTLCRSGAYFVRPVIRTLLGSGPRAWATARLLVRFRRVREALRRVPRVPGLHRVQMEIAAELERVPVARVEALVDALIYRSRYEGLAGYAEPGLAATLAALKGRSLKLGVLSDYPPRAKLAAMGLLDAGWDVVLSAEDVDALKPNPPLFEAALATLALEPGDALYVGDRPDTDVDGPRALGMRTCLVRTWRVPRPHATRADLVVGSIAELALRLARWGLGP